MLKINFPLFALAACFCLGLLFFQYDRLSSRRQGHTDELPLATNTKVLFSQPEEVDTPPPPPPPRPLPPLPPPKLYLQDPGIRNRAYAYVIIYVSHLGRHFSVMQNRSMTKFCELYKGDIIVVMVDNQSTHKTFFNTALLHRACIDVVVLENPTDSWEVGATKVAMDYMFINNITGKYYWTMQHSMELIRPLPWEKIRGFTCIMCFHPMLWDNQAQRDWVLERCKKHNISTEQKGGVFGPSWIVTHEIMMKMFSIGFFDWGMPSSKEDEMATERLLGLLSNHFGYPPFENKLDDLSTYPKGGTYAHMLENTTRVVRKVWRGGE